MTKYQSANNIRNKNIDQPDHGSINQPIINTLECEKGKKTILCDVNRKNTKIDQRKHAL